MSIIVPSPEYDDTLGIIRVNVMYDTIMHNSITFAKKHAIQPVVKTEVNEIYV